MKKKLLLIVAVVFGLTAMYAQKPVDISKKYLKNYTQPYEYVNKISPEGDTIVDQNAEDAFRPLNETGAAAYAASATVGGESFQLYRFAKIGTPWKTEGATTQDDGGQTGWHVDLNKGKAATIRGAMTLTVGWDGFAPAIDNAKVFQTVTLPAGKYSFNAHYGQDVGGGKYSFLVANLGETIPDTTDVANALAHKRILISTTNTPITIEFELTEESVVSLGVVSSFPDASRACLALGDLRLGGFVDGTNYTELKKLVAAANRMQAASYPLGVTGGKYSPEKWEAFVIARAEADTIVRHENTADPLEEGFVDNHTQAEVDAALAALQTAIDELNASFIIPFKVSTEGDERYYLIHDRHNTRHYMMVAEAEYAGEYKWRLEYTSGEVDKEDPKNQFKFVKNPDGEGYFIVSRDLNVPMSVGTEVANFLMFDTDTPGEPFNIKAAVGGYQDYYRLYRVSNKTELNSFGDFANGYIGFWTTTGEDPGSDFCFERVYKEGEINMSALLNEYNKVFSVTSEQFPIGTGAGEFPQDKWDAFVAERAAAKAILDTEDTPEAPKEQAIVDAQVEALQIAFANLVASMNPPMVFSTDAEEVWYFLHDKRADKYFWRYDIFEGAVKIVKEAEAVLTGEEGEDYQFKFVKPADAVGNEFFIYAKAAPEFPLTYIVETDKTIIFAGFDEDADTVRFVAGKTPAFDAEYFTLAISGQPRMQMNSHRGFQIVSTYYPGNADDAGNDWRFIRADGSSVKNATVEDLGIIVRNRKVLSTDANAVISVFNLSGQKLNAALELVPGVYIVTVKGKAGAAKVIVR